MHLNRWIMEEPGYGRAPAVSADALGRFYAAWISWIDKKECIRVSVKGKGKEWSRPFACSEAKQFITGLAMAPFGEGVIIAWIDGPSKERDGLKIAYVTLDGAKETSLIDAYKNLPAYPSLSSHEEPGGYFRFLLAWSKSGELGRSIAACFGRDLKNPVATFDVSGLGDHSTRPSAVSLSGYNAVVWQSQDKGNIGIFSRYFDLNGILENSVRISPDVSGICALPSACRAPGGGIWTAWQSDVDEIEGPGLVRWVDLAHIGDDGVVRYPSKPMLGVNRQGKGEDQGFEAPCLAVLKDGRLAILGRSSQGFWRQDLGACGWSERHRIDEPGWQCRGSKLSAFPVGEGLLMAGQEKGDIAVHLLDPGQPEWSGAHTPVSHKVVPGSKDRTVKEMGNFIVAGHRVLFGDIHQHTAASDGTGTMEEAFFKAEYRFGDDFAAVSDHESFLGKKTPPGEWELNCLAAEEAIKPNSFLTLHAFEWTGTAHPGPGHKVVYLPAKGGPILSRDDEPTKTSRGLIRECRKVGALVFPHHVGWTGADLESHDPEIQTCFEMVSCHGAYERPGIGPIGTRGDDKKDQFIGQALDAGYRFGFVGGSDGHGLNWHHGVCRKKDSDRTGLTAVFPKEATREGLLEALRARRCYATSGVKIGLWFEIDGRPMGEELIASESVAFRAVVFGTAPLESVVIVSNFGAELELDFSGSKTNARGTIPPPDQGSFRYYYIRAVQKNKEAAWSSPIWLDAPSTA